MLFLPQIWSFIIFRFVTSVPHHHQAPSTATNPPPPNHRDQPNPAANYRNDHHEPIQSRTTPSTTTNQPTHWNPTLETTPKPTHSPPLKPKKPGTHPRTPLENHPRNPRSPPTSPLKTTHETLWSREGGDRYRGGKVEVADWWYWRLRIWI